MQNNPFKMFGKKKDKKKKKGMMEKVVMGAIVGGAIGSVVGMAVAPNKGDETRQILKEKGTEAYTKGREFIKDHEKDIQKAKKKGGRIWRLFKKRLRKK